MYHFTGYVPNAENGQPLAGAVLKIFSVDGIEQTLFSDESGTIAGAVTSDENGTIDCWVPAGTYNLVYYYNGEVMRTAEKQQFVTDISADVASAKDDAIIASTMSYPSVLAGLTLPVGAEYIVGSRRYIRISAAPGYEDMGDEYAIITESSLASDSGAALVSFKRGAGTQLGTVQQRILETVSANEFANIKDAIEYDTGVSNVLTIPIGSRTLSGPAAITAYSLIQGQGDMSQVRVPAGMKGISYTSHAGVFDDHPHNLLRDFRITGDGALQAYPGIQNGTTTGISFAEVAYIGSLGSVEGMVIELHAVGRHIKQSYGHNGKRNYYRGNKIGLKLENVTSYAEYDIYARFNSTAAVQIIGGQNVSINGGAIEGNSGKGIEFVPDPTGLWSQLNINDVYFELNGSLNDGICSIDVPFGSNTMVNIRGGSYWLNGAAGKTSGPYRFGDSVALDGATVNGQFYAKEVVSFNNCRGPGVGTWNTMATEALSRLYGLTEPTLFHSFRPCPYEYVFPAAATSGLVIRTKLMGRGPLKHPDVPNIANLTYPYGFSASSGATSSENTSLDYGEGSFWRAQFAAAVGNFSSNYATIATFPDQTKPFRVACMILSPEVDVELGFVMSVGGQSITAYYKLLANKKYRMIFAAQAPMSGPNSVLRMFPLNAAGGAVNVLPIWQGQCASYVDQLKVIEMLVAGNL